MATFKVDIYSDTACPWCYVGNKSLESAITDFTSQHPEASFQLVWHPFFVFPNVKGSTYTYREIYTRAHGPARAADFFRRLEVAGAPLGISFDWQGRTGDMAASHKLLLWASEMSSSGHQDGAASLGLEEDLYPSPPGSPRAGAAGATTTTAAAAAADDDNDEEDGRTPLRRLISAFYRGVFEQGRSISDRGFLASAAVDAGLAGDQEQALRWLDAAEADDMLAERTAAIPDEVSAVPCFVVQDKFQVGGAQPPDVFLQVFERIQREQLSSLAGS
ncbi:uncharacterized protein PgNI_00925 [Pyricularia grisea]|uniref:DSBA-like thioredoxin domain-containing protein n=1 Tax=Pyricularia grisea TaxID=148305 RepID=A0A6P8BHG8_PYRGI|nr:uncharacterized protein PgNI_00925 [Pyricularia grisea]TLD16165.1 hypothetical protein PgNI_00925 [Pyricularia grisea]